MLWKIPLPGCTENVRMTIAALHRTMVVFRDQPQRRKEQEGCGRVFDWIGRVDSAVANGGDIAVSRRFECAGSP
jgi:hypothetical protein